MRKIVDPVSGSVKLIRDLPVCKDKGFSKTAEFRDMNEDDDGYHPYSDRIPENAVYEEDPWR